MSKVSSVQRDSEIEVTVTFKIKNSAVSSKEKLETAIKTMLGEQFDPVMAHFADSAKKRLDMIKATK